MVLSDIHCFLGLQKIHISTRHYVFGLNLSILKILIKTTPHKGLPRVARAKIARHGCRSAFKAEEDIAWGAPIPPRGIGKNNGYGSMET